MYYIYSLKCKDGYYIGCTDDLKDRLERHLKGYVPATVNRLPVELEFYFAISENIKRLNLKNILNLALEEPLLINIYCNV
ncbi:MAG: GIY-YIG nuclease family protein [Candidatus Paceibacterota bacterium]|jgi:predicted GIY-YIG superfamily endonuclease